MLGIGGLIGFFMCVSYKYQLNLLILISFLFIISGGVAYARLIVKAHTLKEIYLGFLVGVLSEILVFTLYII